MPSTNAGKVLLPHHKPPSDSSDYCRTRHRFTLSNDTRRNSTRSIDSTLKPSGEEVIITQPKIIPLVENPETFMANEESGVKSERTMMTNMNSALTKITPMDHQCKRARSQGRDT